MIFPAINLHFLGGVFQLATVPRGYAFCLCQRLPAKKRTTDSHGAMWKTPQEALMNRELLNWTRLIGWWMDGQLFVSHMYICIRDRDIYIYTYTYVYTFKKMQCLYTIYYLYIYTRYTRNTHETCWLPMWFLRVFRDQTIIQIEKSAFLGISGQPGTMAQPKGLNQVRLNMRPDVQNHRKGFCRAYKS